ncbi:Protein pim1 [Tolypocladium ophioglossoides CBS 100239]|uniref:Protein pim1 n=1 Tax=Tolypocladium ophioglossoides (strain CBS 100239) TaxID=1163406 RepID=A0A0L0N405_TOLOC|nr:Protein pim1 [Tolypocladium ophioglossoides CBS 100239]
MSPKKVIAKRQTATTSAAQAGGSSKRASKLTTAHASAARKQSASSASKIDSRPSVASASRKRKDAVSDDTKQRASKAAKIGAGPTRKLSRAVSSRRKTTTTTTEVPRPRAPITPLNQAPTQVLAVFPVGLGDCGELGLGPSKTGIYRPCFNPYLDPNGSPSKFHVVQLSCGGMHTVALTADNEIITWGVNDNHALGRVTEWDGVFQDIDAGSGQEEDGELNPYESTPTAIPASNFPPGTRFVQVAAGDSCSFALTDHGLVYGWGTFRDAAGKEQFGYDANGEFIKWQKTPLQIRGLGTITQIACGANHALALDVKGNIWGWGAHEQNQLGHRLFGRHHDKIQHLTPRRVEVCRNKAKYIASGEYHAFAIDKKDNVWAWGLNSFGEAGYTKGAGGDSALLPYPMKIRDLCGKGVTVIDGGAHHSAAVSGAAEFLVWGRIDGGQLGINFTTEQLGDEDLIRYDERNKPRICLRPTKVPTIGDAVYVACGTDHTLFINKEGSAYATGIGSSGQLGLGSDDDVDVVQ